MKVVREHLKQLVIFWIVAIIISTMILAVIPICSMMFNIDIKLAIFSGKRGDLGTFIFNMTLIFIYMLINFFRKYHTAKYNITKFI